MHLPREVCFSLAFCFLACSRSLRTVLTVLRASHIRSQHSVIQAAGLKQTSNLIIFSRFSSIPVYSPNNCTMKRKCYLPKCLVPCPNQPQSSPCSRLPVPGEGCWLWQWVTTALVCDRGSKMATGGMLCTLPNGLLQQRNSVISPIGLYKVPILCTFLGVWPIQYHTIYFWIDWHRSAFWASSLCSNPMFFFILIGIFGGPYPRTCLVIIFTIQTFQWNQGLCSFKV